MACVPLALLALALALMAVPIYEARYATVAFPAWVLLLAYRFEAETGRPGDRETGRQGGALQTTPPKSRLPVSCLNILTEALLFVNLLITPPAEQRPV